MGPSLFNKGTSLLTTLSHIWDIKKDNAFNQSRCLDFVAFTDSSIAATFYDLSSHQLIIKLTKVAWSHTYKAKQLFLDIYSLLLSYKSFVETDT